MGDWRMSQKRNDAIDILKGIGILLVIVGHTYGPMTNFIYLFHMPIFFMAAGYCYSAKYSESLFGLAKLAKRRLRSLWFPYALINIIFILLNNFFIDINFYTTDESLIEQVPTFYKQIPGHYYSANEILNKIVHALLFNQSTQLTGATWFLEVLFFATLGFAAVDYIIRKITFAKNNKVRVAFHCIVLSVFLVISEFKSQIPFLGKYRLATILVVIGLFEMGLLYKIIEKKIHLRFKYILMIAVLSNFALIVLNFFGSIDLSSHSYSSLMFLFLTSVLGWLMIYGFSQIISKNNFLRKIFKFYGKNSLVILMVHLLFYKPVTILLVNINNLPNYMIASFPVLTVDNGLWIVYSIVNILLCTLLVFVWNKMKGLIPCLKH